MAEPARIDGDGAIRPVQPAQPGRGTDGPGRTADGQTFQDVLRTKVARTLPPTASPTDTAAVEQPPAGEARSIRWSAHAQARLQQRGIQLNEAQQARLEHAVDRAAGKGSRDALVMLDDTAMVVSVSNRTVITALGMHQARDNVFTNIDSAVVA